MNALPNLADPTLRAQIPQVDSVVNAKPATSVHHQESNVKRLAKTSNVDFMHSASQTDKKHIVSAKMDGPSIQVILLQDVLILMNAIKEMVQTDVVALMPSAQTHLVVSVANVHLATKETRIHNA